MTCEECQPLLIDLVSGELDQGEARSVRAHAEHCERCGADLRVLEEGLEASRALPHLPAPTGVRDFVLEEARRQAEAAALRTDPPPPHEEEA